MSGSRPRFTLPTPIQVAATPLRRLVNVVDKARDLATKVGVRAYAVRIVRTRWSSGYRGGGVETLEAALDILPVPRLGAIDSITRQVSRIGVMESGNIEVSSISATYSEDQLMGTADGGDSEDEAVDVFWEIEFIRPDGGPSLRRRFATVAAPYYDSSALGWRVRLVLTQEARDAAGELRN